MDNYIYNGKYFYALTEHGYRKLELYLPAGSGTYKENIDATKKRWLTDLHYTNGYIRLRKPLGGSMVLKVKYAFDNKHFYQLESDELKRILKGA